MSKPGLVASADDLTQDFVKKTLRYDKATGLFYWREGRRTGHIAGTYVKDYWSISIDTRRYRAQELAFLYMLGTVPAGEIVFRDGDRLNNAWKNLTHAPKAQPAKLPEGYELASRVAISTDYLRDCFDYSPAGGTVTWRKRPTSHFDSPEARNEWNRYYVGSPVGGANIHSHFIQVRLLGRLYDLHTLIYQWMTGSAATKTLEHMDGNRINNRWKNLQAELAPMFRGAYTSNTSGKTGVSWHTARKHWVARFSVAGHRQYLGSFDEYGDAVKCRLEAEERYKLGIQV